MNNFGTLYFYELKKIIKRKIYWITLVLCTLCVIITVFSGLIGNYYVDGKLIDSHLHMFQIDKVYRENLSGRKIDQTLLDEMSKAYSHIPSSAEQYTLTDAYQTYAHPYSDIFNLARSWTRLSTSTLISTKLDETSLYTSRQALIEKDWQEQRLSDKEKDFWRNKEKSIPTPLIYFYHEGYEILINIFLTIGLLVLLFIAILLSSVFPDEHAKRTDQLLLCSINGRHTLYWAKILAGLSISVLSTLFLIVLSLCLTFSVYGSAGFNTPLQLILCTYSYPLSVGQACLIAYGTLIITAVIASLFTMVLSELLHSNLATLALSSGMILAGMIVSLPEDFRVVSQIWDSLPMCFLSPWNIFNERTISFFGHCFASWQIIPIIYLLCSIVLALLGNRIYRSYQVSGR